MPCTEPMKAWVHGTHESGKDKYVFRQPRDADASDYHLLPCGKCLSCQIDKSKEWATRGFHESQCHTENSFLTLTYDDKHLPENGSLDKQDLTKFIKRLRRKIEPLKIKFLAAGEYGKPENTHRPHYHICIFGFMPLDKKYLFTNKHGDPVYTSEFISKIWKKGHITVAQVNYRTVAYTARYTVKKIVTKEDRTQEKFWIDPETGETNYDPVAYKKGLLMAGKIPEFITMSNGIGKEWHDKYEKDTHKDYVHVNYAKHKIPRYYDKLMDTKDPDRLEAIKEKRIIAAQENVKTRAQLKSEDIIMKNNIKRLDRNI